MTQTVEDSGVVEEAVAIIDKGLLKMMKRELVSSTEVTDLLLDVRTILAGQGRH